MRRVVLILTLLAVACGDGAASPDPSRFCELDLQIQQLNGAVDGTTPADVQASIEAARTLVAQAADAAPGEIADDYRWFADWQEEFFQLMEDAGYDRSRIDLEAATALTSDENRERFDQAIGTIAGWVNGNCAHGQE